MILIEKEYRQKLIRNIFGSGKFVFVDVEVGIRDSGQDCGKLNLSILSGFYY